MTDANRPATPFLFLALTFALSVPWWALGLFIRASGLPDGLPITDVGAVFMPALAALICSYRDSGWRGVTDLLARLGDWRRMSGFTWLIVLGLAPLLYLLTEAAMRLCGYPLGDQWGIGAQLALVFIVFLIGAGAEEIGYMGYAADPLLQRFPVPLTAIILGVPWALWHLPSMIQLGQSMNLILLGLTATVAYRMIYLELYVRAGRSVLAVVVLHALLNTGRTAFPGGRPAFELGDGLIGYGLVIVLALGIALWPRKPAGSVR